MNATIRSKAINGLALALTALFAGLTGTASATESTLTASDGYNSNPNLQNSSLTNKANWSVKDNFPDSSIDYRVSNGYQIRTPAAGSSVTFGGKSLIVGDLSTKKQGVFGICVRNEDQQVAFTGSDGLRLEYGAIVNQNPRCGIFTTPVTLLNTYDKGFYLQAHQTGASYAHMDFQSAFQGASDTIVWVTSRPSTSSGGTGKIAYYVFSDLSAFYGRMSVAPIMNEPTTYFGTNVIVTIKGASCPGSLDFYQETTLKLGDPAVNFSVANLRLRKDAALAFAADATTGAIPCLTVTGTYVQDDVVELSISDFPTAKLTDTTAQSYDLLKVPSSVEIDKAKFTLPSQFLYDVTPFWRLKVTEQDEQKVLTLYKGETVVQVTNDTMNQESFPGDGAPNTDHWSPAGAIVAGRDYYSENHVIRPLNEAKVQPFAGDSLTLANGSTLSFKAYGIELPETRIIAESKDVQFAHYGAKDSNHLPYWSSYAARDFGGTTKNCNMVSCTNGSIDVYTASDKYFVISPCTLRGIYMTSELKGDGNIKLTYTTESGDAATMADGSVLILDHDNSNFTGKWYLTGPTITTYPARVIPSLGRCSTLYLNSPKNLGGPLSSFAYDALLMDNYACLSPTVTMTLDDATRGIYIWSQKTGQFMVPTNVVFTVKTPITYNGKLYKCGAGTLALGCGERPKFSWQRLDDPTSECMYQLEVAEGAFQAVDELAVDGLQVTFANNTTLVLDVGVSTESGVGRYGMLMTKSSSSLTLTDTVALNFVNSTGLAQPANKDSASYAICTLSTQAAAEALASKFTFDRKATLPFTGKRTYRVTGVSVRANSDGTYSLVANIERANNGFCICFR